MKKILGYILAAIGIILLAIAAIPSIKTAINLPASIPSTALTIAGLLLIVIGIFFLYTKNSQKEKEVPIYEGKNIVGYRRL